MDEVNCFEDFVAWELEQRAKALRMRVVTVEQALKPLAKEDAYRGYMQHTLTDFRKAMEADAHG